MAPQKAKLKRRSNAELEAFKAELDEWMAKNNILEDTLWRTADEHYGQSHVSFPYPHYLVLIAESDLHDILWGYSPPEMSDSDGARCRKEFDEILKRHGIRMEREDNVTFVFMGRS